MRSNKPTLLILAAGLGSRYGSLKQIDRIGPSGEKIIDYSVYDAVRAGFGKIVYVIRKSFEDEFKEIILDELPPRIETSYVFQELDSIKINIETNPNREKPWGTGHALLCAAPLIDNSFAVINADDFYGFNSFSLASKFLISVNENSSDYALIGYKLSNTLSEFGSVSRGVCEIDKNKYMTSIIERTEIKKDKEKIIFKDSDNEWKNLKGSEIISMNMFAFTPKVFESYEKSFYSFLKNRGSDIKAEFYIPSVIDEIINNELGKVKVVQTDEQWFGLTYKQDKEIAKKRIADLVDQGKYPVKLW